MLMSTWPSMIKSMQQEVLKEMIGQLHHNLAMRMEREGATMDRAGATMEQEGVLILGEAAAGAKLVHLTMGPQNPIPKHTLCR